MKGRFDSYSESFSASDLNAALSVTSEVLRDVGVVLKEHMGSPSSDKMVGDFKSHLTVWDTWAQEMIIEQLSDFDKTLGFQAEESGVSTTAKQYWVIDPIDGTLYFSRGNGERCHTAVALMECRSCNDCITEHEVAVPVMSAIYNFDSTHLYTATSYQGSVLLRPTLGGWEKIKDLEVSDRGDLLEFYTHEDDDSRVLEQSAERAGALILRNCAASYSLIQIASGKQDAIIVNDNRYTGQHDIAPGALLVAKAGGEARSLGKSCFSVTDRESYWGLGNVIISSGNVGINDMSLLVK